MAITNLNEYYASKGQALPSVSQRAGLASQAGINNYTGSPQQNASLLKNLTTNPAPATVVDTTKIATSVNNPAPVIPVGVVTEPQKRMTLPTAPVPTASGALSGNAGVLLQQPVINNLNDLSGANAIAQNNSDIASKTYEEQVLSMLNQVQNRPGELQQQYRIQELQSDQATAKAKYDSLDLAYRRQEEATTTNPSLSAEQKQARLSEIGRKKSSELADVAIDYSLKSGLFTNAKSLMDDQIKAELEPMKLKVDYYKTIKDDYRDVLDKTQKLQIDKVIRDEDRAYQQKKDALELANSMKLASFKASLDSKNAVNNSYLSPAMKLKVAANPQFQKIQSKISLSKALEEYKNQIDSFKATGVPLVKLGAGERRALRTTVDTVIGPSLNVAVGQGALSQDEADRILSKLTVNKIGGGSIVKKNADAILSAYKTINTSDLNTLDSLYPGVIDGIPEVAEYYYGNTSNQLTNDDLLNNINGALNNTTSAQVDNSQFFSNY